MKASHSIISILFLVCLFNIPKTFSQGSEQEESNRTCVVAIWPSNVDKVNGIMFNFWSKILSVSDLERSKTKLPKTNGIELNLNPAGIIAGGMMVPYYFADGKYRSPLNDTIGIDVLPLFKEINGLQIALFNMSPTKMNGIEIHLTGSYYSYVNGLSVGIFGNKRKRLNGLGMSLIGNFDTEVNGVQIGLFNTTNKLKGIQIGLWNKNEKRSLPFVNWNF